MNSICFFYQYVKVTMISTIAEWYKLLLPTILVLIILSHKNKNGHSAPWHCLRSHALHAAAAALCFRNTAQYIEGQEHIDKAAIGIAPGRRVGDKQLQGIRHLFLAILFVWWWAVLLHLALLIVGLDFVFLGWNGMKQYQAFSTASGNCYLRS